MRARTTKLAAIALLAVTLTACGDSDTDPDAASSVDATAAAGTPALTSEVPEDSTPAEEPPQASPTPDKPGKFEQTWKTPYADTTCGNFLHQMNDHERWVAAADMLAGARKTDGGSDLPADSEITRFQKDMGTACEANADMKAAEAGATLYLMDPSYRP